MKRLFLKAIKRTKSAVCVLLAVTLITTGLCAEGITVTANGQERIFDIGVNPESVTATLSEDGLLTVSGSGEIKDFTPETALFGDCHITAVKLGADIKAIGSYTFYNCGEIVNTISLPKGLIRIGAKAFSGDSAETAPKPGFVQHPFTEAAVTREKAEETPAPSASPEPSPSASPVPEAAEEEEPVSETETVSEPEALATPEPSGTPEPSAAPEPAGTLESAPEPLEGETKAAPEPEKAASGPEESVAVSSEAEPVSQPEPAGTAKPVETAQPGLSSEAEDSGNKYEIETITKQEIGAEIFYPRTDSPVFACSAGNETFRNAMTAAGYREAQKVISAAFDCGKGVPAGSNVITRDMPVVDGEITLPGVPAEFRAPEGGDLFSYTFGGWTESKDEANMVRSPHSAFQTGDREDLYFIANWNREVLVKITVQRDGDTMVFSVPEIEGYNLTSFRWQTCALSSGQEIPANQELLPWEDIPGETAQTYRRKPDPADSARLFRCVATVEKQQNFFVALFSAGGEEELAFEAVRGVSSAAANEIVLSPGSYEGAVISGEMAPVLAGVDGQAVVPACGYTVSSSPTPIVFCGWKDAAGTHYDPGDLVPGGTVLEAKWNTPAMVVYVNSDSKGALSTDRAAGTSADAACTMSRGFYLLNSSTDKTSPEAIYRNIMVVTASFTSVEDWSRGRENGRVNSNMINELPTYEVPFTLTARAPGGSSANSVTLTLHSSGAFLHADTRIEHITLSGNGKNICGKTKRLIVGRGVTVNGAVNIYGADNTKEISGDTHIKLFSGAWGSVFGGGNTQNLIGDAKIVIAGDASASEVYGGSNTGNSTGSAQVAISGGIVAGNVYGGGKNGALSGGSTAVSVRNGAVVQGNVYGGGDQGAITGSTVVTVSDGAISGNVFGGSRGVESNPDTGAVAGDTSVTIIGGKLGTYTGDAGENFDKLTGSVFGGGEFAQVKKNGDSGGNSSVTIEVPNDIGHPSVGGSAYGGGSQAAVENKSSVRLLSGNVGGAVYGGGYGGNSRSGSTEVVVESGEISQNVYGGGAEGTVSGSTAVTVNGGTMRSVFAAGEGNESAGMDAGRVSGGASVTVSGGSITGGVYGGGYLGLVGSGSDITADEAVVDGQTTVTVTGGTMGSVFAGGSGSGSNPTFGTVFGSTTLAMSGGTVTGSVYGGSNYAYVTGDTHVSLQGGAAPISVGGSVFGGGNLNRNPEEGFDDTSYLVLGNSNVRLDGSGGEITVSGGVFGSGNLTKVRGRRELAIQSFTGTLMCIQRANLAQVSNSAITLIGEDDVTDDQGTKLFSITKIDDMRLCSSVLTLESEARELGALGNYDASGSVSTAEESRSTIQAVPGLLLQIRSAEGYGPVSGVFWLKLAGEATEDMGVRVEADVSGDIGDGTENTGAFLKAADQPQEMISGIIADSYSFWRLGGSTLERKVTISAPRSDSGGQAVVTQSIQLPTSVTATVYKITGVQKTGDFSLVLPTEQGNDMILPAFTAGQTAGNTFALKVQPTSGGETTGWEGLDTEGERWGSYMLTQLPAGETAWNSGVTGVWKRGDSYAVTASSGAGAGADGEIALSLVYDTSYGSFSGGDVEITFQEYPQGAPMNESTVQNTVVVKLTLEGEQGGSSQSAAITRGRSFSEVPSSESVTVISKGALTASFLTEYYPAAAGSEHIYLCLCESSGETVSPVAFPAGARLVLGDMTASENYQYYYYKTDGGEARISLSQFTSLSTGSTSYPGPADITSRISEKLLFTVDFSHTGEGTGLTAGDYFLALVHSEDQQPGSGTRAAFTIVGGEGHSLDFVKNETETTTGVWSIALTPHVPEMDTRYANGACVRITLSKPDGQIVGFPDKVVMTGGAKNGMRHRDGTVSFNVPANSSSTTTFDFSAVPESMLADGDYRLTASMVPQVGLQMGSDQGDPDASPAPLEFSLARTEKEQQRSISVSLGAGSQRLLDVSKGPAELKLDLEYRGMQSGDRLEVDILKKTGTSPEDSSYTAAESTGWVVSPEPGELSGSGETLTVSVPKGQEKGTYRVKLSIVNSAGSTVAEEPYNFIVK